MSSPDTRTTTPTPSPTPLTAAPFLADENALKREFDLEFNAAIAEARSKLGDATSLAPRVVETAFVNVWQQRGSLTAHEQFKSVLTTEIHHGAARALSRRHAAGRFGSGGGSVARDEQTMTGTHAATAEADPEAAWSRITRTIHGEGHTAEAHRAAASATRHEAAAHMKDVAKRPSWVVPVLIGVVALVLALWGVRALSNAGEEDAISSAVTAPGIQPIAASSGQISRPVKLGDGSQMTIGPETKIYIPDQFPTKMRAIRVDGTASFEVAPGGTPPFHVVANHTHFIATGTKFAVSAYPGDSNAKVFVQEGTVTVRFGKQTAAVAANQAMVVDANGIRALPDVQKAEAFAWVNGQATAHGTLRHVVAALTRWFNYDVKLVDPQLFDREAAFEVPLDSSRLAISQVEKSANVKFAYEGETKVFRDASGKPAAKAAKKK